MQKLKGSLGANDYEAMKVDTEALQQAFFKASEKLYQQHGEQPGGPDMGGQGGPGAGYGAGPDMGGQDGGFKDAGGDK